MSMPLMWAVRPCSWSLRLMLVFKLHPLFDCINIWISSLFYTYRSWWLLLNLVTGCFETLWEAHGLAHGWSTSQRDIHLQRRIFCEQQDAKMMFGGGAYRRPHNFLVGNVDRIETHGQSWHPHPCHTRASTDENTLPHAQNEMGIQPCALLLPQLSPNSSMWGEEAPCQLSC